jgi:hypothetical protein
MLVNVDDSLFFCLWPHRRVVHTEVLKYKPKTIPCIWSIPWFLLPGAGKGALNDVFHPWVWSLLDTTEQQKVFEKNN